MYSGQVKTTLVIYGKNRMRSIDFYFKNNSNPLYIDIWNGTVNELLGYGRCWFYR
jgi:hypothetical protein